MTDTREQVERIEAVYTNYRGETANRSIIPLSIRFGSTDWHHEPQWLLKAWDEDRQAWREYALKDFDFTGGALLSRLEAAEAEMDILRTEKHADAEAIADLERQLAEAQARSPSIEEAAPEMTEDEAKRRLLAGDRIVFSMDGDEAWFTDGDRAFCSNVVISLRRQGFLTRKVDEDCDRGHCWDEASPALRALGETQP